MNKPALFDKVSISLIAVSVVVYGLFHHAFNGVGEPITQAEADAYIETFDSNIDDSEISDLYDRYICCEERDKAREELRRFAETDDGRPFFMANIMRFRDQEDMDERGGFDGTVLEADWKYDLELLPLMLPYGAYPMYISQPLPNASNVGASAENDNWSQIAFVRYPSRRAFFDMITSRRYSDVFIYKHISMATMVITPTYPIRLPLNPMPNLTVLLFISLVILNLVVMLVRARRRLREVASAA